MTSSKRFATYFAFALLALSNVAEAAQSKWRLVDDYAYAHISGRSHASSMSAIDSLQSESESVVGRITQTIVLSEAFYGYELQQITVLMSEAAEPGTAAELSIQVDGEWFTVSWDSELQVVEDTPEYLLAVTVPRGLILSEDYDTFALTLDTADPVLLSSDPQYYGVLTNDSGHVLEGELALEVEVGVEEGTPVSVNSDGEFGIGTTDPQAALDVHSETVRVAIPYAPRSWDPCTRGEIAWSEDAIYVCVLPNTWRRSALVDY